MPGQAPRDINNAGLELGAPGWPPTANLELMELGLGAPDYLRKLLIWLAMLLQALPCTRASSGMGRMTAGR